MSNTLFDHSPDLKRLRDEGYEVEIKGSHVLVHHVPYVNSSKEVKFGTLVSTLTLATPTKAGKPPDHVIHFTGDQPCDCNGAVIQSLPHPHNGPKVLDEQNGIATKCSFSNKPQNDFPDYYEKFVSYIGVISAPAFALDSTVKVKTFRPIVSSDPNYVFKYCDTNSSRAEILAISTKLENYKVAIVGLGGTGSYVLDFLAKTPVLEIHLFDGDDFLVHNAFRAPGATAIDQFAEGLKKVSYLAAIYSNMHKYVVAHPDFVTPENVVQLSAMNFVFICVDDGSAKKTIISYLLANRIQFVDCGMGIEAANGSLGGLLRVTTGTPERNDHIERRIGFSEPKEDDYNQNIQIAELNALNAALAVIKWKKLAGFYHDFENEHNTIYDVNVNKLFNDETPT